MTEVNSNIKKFKSENQWIVVGKRLKRNKVAMIALYFLILTILISVFYPILISFNPTSIAPARNSKYGGGANASPNLKYPAGTDIKGRDGYSRLLVGSETSMTVGIVATLISLVIGVLVGMVAGYYQGSIEEILMRIVDLFLAVPFLLIALLLVNLITSGKAQFLANIPVVMVITYVIGLFGWAGLARLVTANVKQVSSLEYVSAARVMGANDLRILFVHIFPNILAPIIVLGALFVAGAILSEAGLAFLGLGDPANTVSWGIMVSQSQGTLYVNPEQALAPGFAIFFVVLAANLFGDALRDALDPKLKQ